MNDNHNRYIEPSFRKIPITDNVANHNIAALYCRLSKEDVDKIDKGDESASIINQRILLEDYALDKGFSIFNVYQDDDYSGLFDTRPAFEQMIEDAKAGKFNIIIAKTQSRFTRNMEHMEHYLHDLFPSLGIRFISVVDNVDTMNRSNKKSRQINGLINEWYCEDLSENIKAVFKSKMKQGQYIGQSAPYGYIKDPNDNHKLIIDEYAASVVRRIFSLYLDGFGKRSVAATLNREGILIPSKYKKEVLKSTYYNPRCSNQSLWTFQTVDSILKNEMYTGAVVQNKQVSISYKNKKKIKVPEEQQIKVYGMHEPIISKEIWDLTQEALKLRTRETKIEKKIGLFSDKLYCADCGKYLTRLNNRKHEFIGYHCSTYKRFGTTGCSSHFIRSDELKEIVLNSIKNVAREILKPEEVDSLKNIKSDSSNNSIDAQLKHLTQKKIQLQSYTEKIYRDYLDEIITRDEYIKFKGQYMNELAEIEERINAIETSQSSENENYKRIWQERFSNYADVDELTRPMVLELIDKIEITKDGDVHIAFRFSK